MNRTVTTLLTVLTTCYWASSQAALIEYRFAGIGSGSIGGVRFSETPFTIEVLADTNDVAPPAVGFGVLDISTQFSLSGIASGTFLQGKRVIVGPISFQSPVLALAPDYANGRAELALADEAFGTYDLRTPFGPSFYSGPAFSLVTTAGTTAGSFQLDTSRNLTLAAVLVPEPTSALFSLAVMAVTSASRRIRGTLRMQ